MQDHRMNPLHPDNKIQYQEGHRIEFVLDGDVSNILTGTIRGKVSEHLIDHWIVQFDTLLPGYQYSCASIQHTFIRPLGDNRPFLCEGRSRVPA